VKKTPSQPSQTRQKIFCDSSFVGHLLRRENQPERYEHWDDATLAGVEAASLAISIVTIAEIRAGYLNAHWGRRRVTREELALARYMPILIDGPHLDEWARLRVAARGRGIALSDNDLWIAAAASVRQSVLVTCDRDHVRIARDLAVEVVYLQPPV
jgi:predicted nucleic acid-binding protein